MSNSVDCPGLRKIKYIIIFEYGRLGNQFFQYLAARSVLPKAQIICIGLHSLFASLDPLACYSHNSNSARLLRRFFTTLGRDSALSLAKHKRTWSLVWEIRSKEGSSLSFSEGIFSSVAVFDGFFQDNSIFDNFSPEQFPLRDKLLLNAREWLELNVIARGFNPYFLHLRRGDYVRWPSTKHPAVLPSKWYQHQIDEIALADKNAHFIVLTDDHPYVEEFFGSCSMVTIYRGSEIEDFFIMTQCLGGGILSASTFSWWAAWYGNGFFKGSRYIAPHYWAGWRQKKWYPPRIKTSWLEYRPVY